MTDTIYEFRDYTLQPGQRETLIELFEREFIDPQNELGAHVRATFRDLDNPDQFVWMRSFADAGSRFAALDAFYTGPIWQAHRSAANATIIDSDNVLQLNPVSGTLDTKGHAIAHLVATTYFLAPNAGAEFIRRFFSEATAELDAAAPFATFVTDPRPNAYPRLPVRDNETVFLTLSRAEQAGAAASLSSLLIAPTQTRRLASTARSPLR